MIPVAFVGGQVSLDYLTEYINVAFPKEDETQYTEDELDEAYRKFLEGFDLTLNEDIFIIPTNTIEDCNDVISKDRYLIGSPITTFSPSWSIRRMEIEVFNLLTDALDFFVNENTDIIRFYIFNLR